MLAQSVAAFLAHSRRAAVPDHHGGAPYRRCKHLLACYAYSAHNLGSKSCAQMFLLSPVPYELHSAQVEASSAAAQTTLSTAPAEQLLHLQKTQHALNAEPARKACAASGSSLAGTEAAARQRTGWLSL